MDYKTVSAVTVPDAEASIDRSYLVPAGKPGLHEA